MQSRCRQPNIKFKSALCAGWSAYQELAKAVISKLQADNKLAAVLEVDSRNGNTSISGRVNEVSMIYRVVEIIKDNTAVKSVDVRQLDT